MKTYLTAAILGLACLGASAQERWDSKSMNRTIEQTNFVVNQGCSGTLIDVANRYVLTANHCVSDQYETVEREEVADDGEVTTKKVRRLREGSVSQLTFQGAESVVTVVYKTNLKAIDKSRDLALLQIKANIPNKEAARLACDAPARGDVVYTVGNPQGLLYSSVTTGIVSSLQRTYGFLGITDGESDDQSLMQISGGVVGGNSGGAVYNASGKLIGVPVRANRMNEVLGFAVPLTEIKAFLADNRAGIYADCPPSAE